MWSYITDTLRANPQLAIFFTLAVGYWVGTRKFGSFSLGAVTGTLLAGVVIGQIGIDISGQVKSVFFILFLFAVGFGVGPQFVRGIATDGAPQALFAVVVSVLCLAGGLCCGDCLWIRSGPCGRPACRRADDLSFDWTRNRCDQSAWPASRRSEETTRSDPCRLCHHVSLRNDRHRLDPRLSRPEDAGRRHCRSVRALRARRSRRRDEGCRHDERVADARGPRIPHSRKWSVAGKSIAQAEGIAGGERIFVERLRRDGEIVPHNPDTILKAGDIIAVSGRREVLVNTLGEGEEVEDREVLDIPIEAVDVLITSKALDGRELVSLAKEPYTRGVYLNSIRRGSAAVNIPVLPKTKINRGDIMRVSGSKAQINRFVAEVGYADRPQTVTDMVLVGLAIMIGGLIGAAVLPIGGVPITLSTSGGALIAGIFVGWLRTVKPQIGNIPQPTLWFMNSVGLNVFIAIVGITSGPTFIAGLKEAGFGLFIWGIIATSVPMLLAPYIGKYIFRFHDAINLGCCGGARTSTASVAMVGEVAKSDVPMLGYTVPYAVSNTLLTLWGLIIVLMVT